MIPAIFERLDVLRSAVAHARSRTGNHGIAVRVEQGRFQPVSVDPVTYDETALATPMDYELVLVWLDDLRAQP